MRLTPHNVASIQNVIADLFRKRRSTHENGAGGVIDMRFSQGVIRKLGVVASAWFPASVQGFALELKNLRICAS